MALQPKKKISDRIAFPLRSAAVVNILPVPRNHYSATAFESKTKQEWLHEKLTKCRADRIQLEKLCDEFNQIVGKTRLAKSSISTFFRLKVKQDLLEQGDATEEQVKDFQSNLTQTRENVEKLKGELIERLKTTALRYYESFLECEEFLVNNESDCQTTRLVFFQWDYFLIFKDQMKPLSERLLLFETCMAANLYLIILHNSIHLRIPANFQLDEAQMKTITTGAQHIYKNVMLPRMNRWNTLKSVHNVLACSNTFFNYDVAALTYQLLLIYYYDERMILNMSTFEKELVGLNDEKLGRLERTPDIKMYTMNIKGISINRRYALELQRLLLVQYRSQTKNMQYIVPGAMLIKDHPLSRIVNDRIFCCDRLLQRYAAQLLYQDSSHNIDGREAISRHWKMDANDQIRQYLKYLGFDINVRSKRYKKSESDTAVNTLDIIGGIFKKSISTRNVLMILDLTFEYWISILYFVMDSLDYEINYVDSRRGPVFANVSGQENPPTHNLEVNIIQLSKRHNIPLDHREYLNQKIKW